MSPTSTWSRPPTTCCSGSRNGRATPRRSRWLVGSASRRTSRWATACEGFSNRAAEYFGTRKPELRRSLEEQLNKYLADAHVIEAQALKLLDKGQQIADARELAAAYEEHHTEAEEESISGWRSRTEADGGAAGEALHLGSRTRRRTARCAELGCLLPGAAGHAAAQARGLFVRPSSISRSRRTRCCGASLLARATPKREQVAQRILSLKSAAPPRRFTRCSTKRLTRRCTQPSARHDPGARHPAPLRGYRAALERGVSAATYPLGVEAIASSHSSCARSTRHARTRCSSTRKTGRSRSCCSLRQGVTGESLRASGVDRHHLLTGARRRYGRAGCGGVRGARGGRRR